MLSLSRKSTYYYNREDEGGYKLLEDDGWYLARTKGSHRQFKHGTKAGAVTVSGKLSIDIPRGTLNSIFKQAGLKEQE